MEAPRSSPIAASVATKIKHVARFIRQYTICVIYLRQVLDIANHFFNTTDLGSSKYQADVLCIVSVLLIIVLLQF